MINSSSGLYDLTPDVSARLATLRFGAPGVIKSFGSVVRAAMADGTLTITTKELMTLVLGVAARWDRCIGSHVQDRVKVGASRRELDAAFGVVVYMGG